MKLLKQNDPTVSFPAEVVEYLRGVGEWNQIPGTKKTWIEWDIE